MADTMSNKTVMPLEQRISAALLDANAASGDLTILLEEVEAALADSDRAASDAREQAFDLFASPDAAAARETMQAAEFNAARLRAALPKRKQKIAAAEANEYARRWSADYRRVEAKVAEAARRFAEYSELVAELVAIFREARAVVRGRPRQRRGTFGRASSPPPCRTRCSRSRTLHAGRAVIAQTVQLPDCERSNRLAWPPPRKPLGVLAVHGMQVPYDPRYTADWWRGHDERAAAQRAEQERVAAFYRDQQRAKEEREKAAR
jgi:hypothetical protein